MKTLIIRIVLAVGGYQVPVEELEARLGVVGPVKIEVVDLANPQPVEDFKKHYYSILALEKQSAMKIYIHAPYESDGELLFGGHGNFALKTGSAGIIPGRDEENMQLILHEIGHAIFNLNHDAGCSVMSAIPCGLQFKESDILKAKKWLKRKKKI